MNDEVKENCGCDAVTLQNGYRKLNGGPERVRDNQVYQGGAIVETENGGFLGRTESHDSASSKA